MKNKKAKLYYKFVHTHEFYRFLLLDRIENKKDNIVLVTGKRGSGKSSFSIKIANGFKDWEKLESYYNKQNNIGNEEIINYKLKNYMDFDIDRDIVFDKNSLQKLCEDSRKGFIVSDEAIVSTGRRNSMTKTNKLLHQILTINRKNFNTIFFCLPSVEDFDLSILQYVSMWIHIDDRGLGVVLLPSIPSIFGRKSWDIDSMKKTYDKFLEENPTIVKVPYWLFDNFRGYIKFGAMNKELEEKYLSLAHEKKNIDSSGEKEEKEKNMKQVDDTKKKIIKNIVDNIINGKLYDVAEYYKNCAMLDFKKDRLNRMVNDELLSRGDGRSYSKIIRENLNNHKQENDNSNRKPIVWKP